MNTPRKAVGRAGGSSVPRDELIQAMLLIDHSAGQTAYLSGIRVTILE